jgi:hypothetical protein
MSEKVHPVFRTPSSTMGWSNAERQRHYRERREQRSKLCQATKALLPLYAMATTKSSSAAFHFSTARSSSALLGVLATLPQQYRMKYIDLIQYLMANSRTIRTNGGGRLVNGGEMLDRSSFIEGMRSLYVRGRWKTLSRTAHEILRKLHSMGVPSWLLSSPAVRAAYEELDGVRPHTSGSMPAGSAYGDSTPRC